MQKFINAGEDAARESLEGFALANADLVELASSGIVLSRALAGADRVTVMTQGGSGHEPALSGFVGEGMLDASVAGDIFAAPGPDACVEAMRRASRGHGVLYVVLNQPGDLLTAEQALHRAREEGLAVQDLVTREDVASAPRAHSHDRRGLVGCVPVFKIAGAAAAAGKTLEEVYHVTRRFADNMAALAVTAKGGIHPVSGAPLSGPPPGEMQVGAGQHGEGGGTRQPMRSADETAELVLDILMRDLSITRGEKVLLILNGSGATTLMELFILYRRCAVLLEKQGVEIVANHVGELLTVQEQAGFQMLLARMDVQTLKYWNAPCNTPYFKKI